MEEKELKAFQDKLEKADKNLEEIQKGLADKAGLEDVKKAMEAIKSVQDTVASISQIEGKSIVEYVKNVQEHANDLEKQYKEKFLNAGGKEQTIKGLVKELITSDDFKNHVKSMQSGNVSKRFELKAAADLLTSDWGGTASDTPGLPQYQIPGVTKHPWRNTPIYASVPKRTIGLEHQVKYTEESTRTDSAALKTEGSQYVQSGATWITRPVNFYDIGHYAKVTRESLEDAEYIMQEVNDLLSNGLLRALEVLLASGSGSSTILGVFTAAKAFAKVLGTSAVTSPTIRDVLLAAKLQVGKGINATASTDTNKTGYNANLALLGKAAMYNGATEKDEIGRPLVDNPDQWKPSGLTVVESEDLTENANQSYFCVGDFNKAMLYLKRNLIIETGFDGNDFTYGMSTIRASLRGGFVIKEVEKYAFVYGELGDAKSKIAV